jgi:hypothetical protein
MAGWKPAQVEQIGMPGVPRAQPRLALDRPSNSGMMARRILFDRRGTARC